MGCRAVHRATVLMYHNIGTPPKGTGMRGLYVTPRMFCFQMWYLRFAGFRVVSLGEILDFARGNKPVGKMVAITFDDGYQDFYDNAWPVLKKYGYPSAVFLVSGLIGGENIWDSDTLRVRKRLMDNNLIHELRENRVTFGSHTKSHPFLTRLSVEELADEISGSKSDLEAKLSVPVEFFCYPYGDRNGNVEETVKAAGYHAAFTTDRGFVHRGDNLFTLKRARVSLNTHPLSFIWKLHSDHETRKGPKT
jgi:peptidoglycan/xylan/chitin deacetylase (PgdA/CDA1 family)